MADEQDVAETADPQYVTRSVTRPNGSRVIAVCKPGALDHLSDEEFVAEFERVAAEALNEGGSSTRHLRVVE